MKYMVVGGAGFIGSHVTKRLLTEELDSEVLVYDNFSSGSEKHLGAFLDDKTVCRSGGYQGSGPAYKSCGGR